jgi:hypothetical protein
MNAQPWSTEYELLPNQFECEDMATVRCVHWKTNPSEIGFKAQFLKHKLTGLTKPVSRTLAQKVRAGLQHRVPWSGGCHLMYDLTCTHEEKVMEFSQL